MFGQPRVNPTERLVKEVLERVGQESIAEIRALRTEVDSLRAIQKAELQKLAKLLIDSWRASSAVEPLKLHFDDPLWGQSVIDKRLAMLFGHPMVQRLNYIRQLSFAYLAFPSATHTRMSHSLGVSRLIENALTTVFRNNIVYTESGVETIQLSVDEREGLILKAKTAAFLHDVGHAPFGHALDKLVGFHDPAKPLAYPDKHYSQIYLAKYLSGVIPESIDVDNLIAVLAQDSESLTGWDIFISDLIDSSLDVDRMDFLARDAHMSGLSMGSKCAEALIDRMCPFRSGNQIYLTYDMSCLPYVGDLLFAREKMYVHCYEHPKKLAAERIFTRLVQGLIEKKHLTIDELVLLTDEQVLALLGLAALGSVADSELLRALLQNTHYSLVHEASLKGPKDSAVGQWSRVRDRDGMGNHVYLELPAQWETEITIASKLPKDQSWRVLVVVPDHKAGSPPGLATKVLEKRGAGYRAQPLLRANGQLLNELKYAAEPRGRIRVFADSRLNGDHLAAVKKAAEDILGG